MALKDDPTILGANQGFFATSLSVNASNHRTGWESGNELSGARFGDGPAPANWTKEMGDLIKSLAPNHLFREHMSLRIQVKVRKLIQAQYSGWFL